MNEVKKKTVWQNYRFSILLLAGIILGSVIGAIAGEKAVVLKPFGDIFINMMFTVIVPLVFVTVSSAVGNMMNMKRLGKILGNMLLVFFVTGIIAAILISLAVTIFPPAKGVNIPLSAADNIASISFADAIVNAITVGDFSQLLSKSHMLPLIIFSIMFGFCVSACGGEESYVGKLLKNLSDVIMKLVSILCITHQLDYVHILQILLENMVLNLSVRTVEPCLSIIQCVSSILSSSFRFMRIGVQENLDLPECGKVFSLQQ